MKILMFSINPLFPNKVTGGASKHLFAIANHLGAKGHEVSIFCAKSENVPENFSWGETIKVSAVLPFNIPFPQPYAISGGDLAYLTESLSNALDNVDRFYIHDGEWLIPDVYETVPTVISFRDNIYPESVLGSFIGKGDEVICVSSYSGSIIEHTAGRFFPDLIDRLHIVNNGIDLRLFSPKDSVPLAKMLRIDTKQNAILLHPHRPEPGKGLPETIKVVDHLVHKKGLKNVKVLVPEWIDEMVSSRDAAFTQAMQEMIHDLGVDNYFIFVPWMPLERMPELYSLADVTLCLGNMVEAFGNVAYESLACGTPSIVTRVGVHRTMLPDDLIDKVHYGDIEDAVDRILAYLNGREFSQARILDALNSTMNFEQQVERYADLITQCQKRERLRYIAPKRSAEQEYILAPWCYIDGNRLYHDFTGGFFEAGQLTNLLKVNEQFNFKFALNYGISQSDWDEWISKTWIVPINQR